MPCVYCRCALLTSNYFHNNNKIISTLFSSNNKRILPRRGLVAARSKNTQRSREAGTRIGGVGERSVASQLSSLTRPVSFVRRQRQYHNRINNNQGFSFRQHQHQHQQQQQQQQQQQYFWTTTIIRADSTTTTAITRPATSTSAANAITTERSRIHSNHFHDHRQQQSFLSLSKQYFATSATTSQSSSQQQQQEEEEEEETRTNNINITYERPKWLQKMDHCAFEKNLPMDSQKVYTYLRLDKYTTEELENRFQCIVTSRTCVIGREQEGTIGEGDNYDDECINELASFNKERLRSYIMRAVRIAEDTTHNKPIRQLSSSTPTADTTDFLRNNYVDAETQQLWNFLVLNQDTSTTSSMTKQEFTKRLIASATSIDRQRLWPLTASMIMIGLSVGVTTPAFPFVVQNLGLSTGEYGMVVSAFALTKLLGNIPFAVLVERHGRKPYLVYSMIGIAVGVGAIGLASGVEELYVCRLITGLGVAGLSCAATMTVTDISTPLNRASSYAPIATGFAIGTATGPALGGILLDLIGVQPTFFLVGGSFLVLGGVNSLLLDETIKQRNHRCNKLFPWQQQQQQQRHNSESESSDTQQETESITQAFGDALGQWKPLLSLASIRNVCIMNGFYWVALSGSQMTLLPLLLTDPVHGLAMTATQIGQVYMGMSCVQVFGNPIFARVVDKVGTTFGIVSGCSLISFAMYTLPSTCDPNTMQQMAMTLGLWAAGSSLLSSAPIAHISNCQDVDDSKRAQAIALLRTSGDIGFLIGASTMGLLSDWAGSLDVAMQSSSAILGTATSWYLIRSTMLVSSSSSSKKIKK